MAVPPDTANTKQANSRDDLSRWGLPGLPRAASHRRTGPQPPSGTPLPVHTVPSRAARAPNASPSNQRHALPSASARARRVHSPPGHALVRHYAGIGHQPDHHVVALHVVVRSYHAEPVPHEVVQLGTRQRQDARGWGWLSVASTMHKRGRLGRQMQRCRGSSNICPRPPDRLANQVTRAPSTAPCRVKLHSSRVSTPPRLHGRSEEVSTNSSCLGQHGERTTASTYAIPFQACTKLTCCSVSSSTEEALEGFPAFHLAMYS